MQVASSIKYYNDDDDNLMMQIFDIGILFLILRVV